MSIASRYLKGEIDIFQYLRETLNTRIMYFDGAMGSMIQVRFFQY